ncbi:MAG: hypothetical protein GM45_3080 [actinobacterium acAMD-5]|jgi:glycine cleavage system transcriptional repressor|nr:MAG: hypothetical protein GM45_3080 [actinobacterium acAMD-5]
MTSYAITVFGTDRPGIVATITSTLAESGANIEDTSMTLLQGHFAMTLIAQIEIDAQALEAKLATALGEDLTVSVSKVRPDQTTGALGTSYVLTVQGGDKPGIVAAVTKIIAKHQGNITDLTTRLSQSLYLLVAEVSLPTGINLEAINSELVNVGKDFGIALHLTLVEEDVL